MPSKPQSPVSVVDDLSGLQKSDSSRQSNTSNILSKIKKASNTISPNIMNKAVNASKKLSARKMSKRLQGLPKVMRSANLIKTSKTLSPPKNLINRFTKKIKSAPMVMNNVRKSTLTPGDVDDVKSSINDILNNAELDNEIVSVINDYNVVMNLETQFLYLVPDTIHEKCIKKLAKVPKKYSKMSKEITPTMMKIGSVEVNKILNATPINGGSPAADSPPYSPANYGEEDSPPPPPRRSSARRGRAAPAAAVPAAVPAERSQRKVSRTTMVQTDSPPPLPPPPPSPPIERRENTPPEGLRSAHYMVQKNYPDSEETLNDIVMQYVNEYIKTRKHLMFGFIAALGPNARGGINITDDIDEFNFSSYRIYADILYRYNDHEKAKRALTLFRFALFIKLLLATTLSLAFISITAAGLVKVSKLGKDAIALGVNNIYNLVLVNKFQEKEVMYFQKVINMVVPSKYAMGVVFTVFTLFGSSLKPPVKATLRDTETGIGSILMHTLLFFIELGILTRKIGTHLINAAIKKKIDDVKPTNNMVSLTGKDIYRKENIMPLATSRGPGVLTNEVGSAVSYSTPRNVMNAERDSQLKILQKQAAQREAAAAAAATLVGMKTAGGKSRRRRTSGKRRRNVRQTRRRRR